MTENELFNLVYFGDVNDPAVLKRLSTARISRVTMERVQRRVRAAIRLDFERALLNALDDEEEVAS